MEEERDVFCNKCGFVGKAIQPHYRHDGCNYSANWLGRDRARIAELEAALQRATEERDRYKVSFEALDYGPLIELKAKLAEVERERDGLLAAVKHWEDREANRAHDCYNGSLEAERAEAAETKVGLLERQLTAATERADRGDAKWFADVTALQARAAIRAREALLARTEPKL